MGFIYHVGVSRGTACWGDELGEAEIMKLERAVKKGCIGASWGVRDDLLELDEPQEEPPAGPPPVLAPALRWDKHGKHSVTVSEGGTVATHAKTGGAYFTLATCEGAKMEGGRHYVEFEILGDDVSGLYMGVVKSEVDADVCAHNMARGLAAKYRAE